MHGSQAAGGKEYTAPRKRGHSKNGRTDAPQIVIGLAVTREGFPVRHWVFPGNTVDVTTVAKVKKDLKGWQLNRCLFVGDAGMVSQANFQSLAKGGGKYLMAMPMRRGDEVTEAVLGRPGRYRKVYFKRPRISVSQKAGSVMLAKSQAQTCALYEYFPSNFRWQS
jgi:hypothetical protein